MLRESYADYTGCERADLTSTSVAFMRASDVCGTLLRVPCAHFTRLLSAQVHHVVDAVAVPSVYSCVQLPSIATRARSRTARALSLSLSLTGAHARQSNLAGVSCRVDLEVGKLCNWSSAECGKKTKKKTKHPNQTHYKMRMFRRIMAMF